MISIEKFLTKVSSLGEESVKRQRAAILTAYKLEIVSTIRRVSEIKNLVYRNKPAKIHDIYVSPMILDGKITITADDLFYKFVDGERIVLRGSAGLGKSVLLKRFCLQHVETETPFAPLFLELRKIEAANAGDIVLALFNAYKGNSSSGNITDFQQTLRYKGFSVILDGFDEVSPSLRDIVEGAILTFSLQYPSVPLIISGRSERSFLSWEEFTVYDIKPMSEELTIQLINRLDVDNDLKERFIAEAIPKLFSNNDISFVQTPLLAILMLLTFSLFVDVPDKMHIFYGNAFETLMKDHDITKSQFRRPLASKISEEDFKRVFAAFCTTTYFKKELEFSYSLIEERIAQSLAATSTKAPVRDIVNDLTLSVCVMQYESLEYSFVHRSFQEYFTAVFLKNSAFSVVRSFLESQSVSSRETVLPMLMDMDRERIEKEYAFELVNNFAILFEGQTHEERIEKVMRNYWGHIEIGISEERVTSLSAPKGVAFPKYSIVELMYPKTGAPVWWIHALELKESDIPTFINHPLSVEKSYSGIISENGNRREFDIDISKFTYQDAKDTGIYQTMADILKTLDDTVSGVRSRVGSSNTFVDQLFAKN